MTNSLPCDIYRPIDPVVYLAQQYHPPDEPDLNDEPEEEEPPPPRLINLAMNGKEISITVQCEAIASDGHNLALVSAVGPASSIKALTVGLRNPELASFKADDCPVKLHEYSSYGLSLRGGQYGWECHKHFLGLGTWHLLAWSKWNRLLVTGDDEALWQRLRSEEFTTPLLRGWIPGIRQQLVEHKLLTALRCFNCEAWYLSADDKAMDEIVSAGVLSGELRFE